MIDRDDVTRSCEQNGSDAVREVEVAHGGDDRVGSRILLDPCTIDCWAETRVSFEGQAPGYDQILVDGVVGGNEDDVTGIRIVDAGLEGQRVARARVGPEDRATCSNGPGIRPDRRRRGQQDSQPNRCSPTCHVRSPITTPQRGEAAPAPGGRQGSGQAAGFPGPGSKAGKWAHEAVALSLPFAVPRAQGTAIRPDAARYQGPVGRSPSREPVRQPYVHPRRSKSRFGHPERSFAPDRPCESGPGSRPPG